MLYWTRQRYVWIPYVQQKCDEPALCVQQIHVAKEIKFRSRYMFVYHCNINNPEYHVRRRFDRERSRIPVKKLRKLSHKNKKIKKLVYRRILKNIPFSSKMDRYIKCRLRARGNSDSIKLYTVNTTLKIRIIIRIFV